MASIIHQRTADAAEPGRKLNEPPLNVRDLPLLTLVQEYDVSVRLKNSILGAAAADELPLKTIGEYADAGDLAQLSMLRVIRNFGRKTARELHALVLTALATDPDAFAAHKRAAEPAIDRAELLSALGDDTIATLIYDELLSVRLSNVLSQANFLEWRFADVVDQFASSCQQLMRQPNCGRKSVNEFRQFCERNLHARFCQAGYVDPVALAAWLTGGPPPTNVVAIGGPGEAGKERGLATSQTADPFAPPEHESLAERLEWLMSELVPRAQQILRRRNGIGQADCETLDEIGRDHSVTRERIRQIEAKALKRLRIRVRRTPLGPLLEAEGPAAWTSLAGGAELMRRGALHEKRRALDPYIRLALDIEELSLESWLDQVAPAMPHGWLAPGSDTSVVEAAAAKLEAAFGRPSPQALKAFVGPDNVEAARAAAILILGRPVCEDYLMPPRVGVRLTRLVRLHAILAGHGETLPLECLTNRYRAIFDDDQCSDRDAEIVMDAAPHLFLEIEEGSWSAIGPAGSTQPSPPANHVSAPRPEDPGTIAHALQVTLQRQGPTRLVDLMDDAAQILPEGRSANSIGPVLLTRRELFVRALPGVYALPEHIPAYVDAMPEDWPMLFNDSQARFYAIARYAGEPRRIFPLWSAAVEFALCRWARHSGGTGIFPSLLAVATIEDWPIDAQAREEWRRQQRQEGRYSLGVGLRHGAAYELPPLERLFGACRYAASEGHFNWVAGNRLTGRKIDSHGGAGLVALLLRLGAISEAVADGYRWQRPHRATATAATLAQRLEDAFSQNGLTDWSDQLGRELAHQATSQVVEVDWVDDPALAAMFSRSPESATGDSDEDDPLEQLIAAQRRAREAERREATLDWLIEE